MMMMMIKEEGDTRSKEEQDHSVSHYIKFDERYSEGRGKRKTTKKKEAGTNDQRETKKKKK